jgi:hypothetical protein
MARTVRAHRAARLREIVAVGEGGLLAGHRTHADALVDREAAALDDALLEAPALVAGVLEIQVGVVDPVLGNGAERPRQGGLVELIRLQQQPLGHGQALEGRFAGDHWRIVGRPALAGGFTCFCICLVDAGLTDGVVGRRRRFPGDHSQQRMNNMNLRHFVAAAALAAVSAASLAQTSAEPAPAPAAPAAPAEPGANAQGTRTPLIKRHEANQQRRIQEGRESAS